MSKSSEVLQAAFDIDPNAMHALVCNRVPCNQALADDPHEIVHESLVLNGHNFQVGMLGVLNGVLAANDLPKVAAMWSDATDEQGRHKFVGFCDYVKPSIE